MIEFTDVKTAPAAVKSKENKVECMVHEMILMRTRMASRYTLGELTIDGEKFDTIEPPDAMFRQNMDENYIRAHKLATGTAIPQGRYRVILSRSPKFQEVLPEVLNVRGFSGIRIHAGNRVSDTRGCIIVGHHLAGDILTRSRDTLTRVIELIYQMQETGSVYLQIYHKVRT